MTDPRVTFANARVASTALRGQVAAPVFADPNPAQVIAEVTDIRDQPGGTRMRQVQLGAALQVLEYHAGDAFVQTDNGYVGYVDAAALGPPAAPTHRVATLATHAYTSDDFKSPELMRLGFDAQVLVLDEREKFFETPQGFIPKKHLRPLDRPFDDPATIAQLHFQVPYLWGGNSALGLDCSGLISAALAACNIPCPGDSDMQRDMLGTDASAPYQRGDLLFWKGHVGMMVDETVLIHANAHHMAVAYEPIAAAMTRIVAQGDGPVIAHKRLG